MTRCWLSETHIAINTQGLVSPCCRYVPDESATLTNSSIENIFNHKKLKQVRNNLKNGIKDPGCIQCWSEEDAGISSMRMNHNRDPSVNFSNLTGSVDDIRSMEIAFDNYCNMKCRHCRTASSSRWKNDDLLLGRYVPDRLLQESKVDSSQLAHLKNLKMFKILGGEPFLSKSHTNFILNLDHIEKISIEYVTNGSIFPSPNIIDRLKLLKNLQITISLDDVEEYFDYFRSDGNFSVVKKNTHRFMDLISNNTKIGFHIVVNVLNAYRLSEILKYILIHFPSCSFIYIDKIHEPTYLLTNQWDQKTLQNESEKIKHLKKICKNKNLNCYLDHASDLLWKESLTATNNFNNFFSINDILDRSRNTKLTEIHPIFKNILNQGSS
jgi:radical SAM protein with 4Fe4S-binding SPASM domain